MWITWISLMQSQFSLFADPAPPATWVSGPPVAISPPPADPPQADPEPELDLESEIELAPEPPAEDVVVDLELEPSAEPEAVLEMEPELETLTPAVESFNPQVVVVGSEDEHSKGLTCPNCGSPLEGRKCKLLCLKPGCGYMVTCSEW